MACITSEAGGHGEVRLIAINASMMAEPRGDLEAVAAKRSNVLRGEWRIIATDTWDSDGLDLAGRARPGRAPVAMYRKGYARTAGFALATGGLPPQTGDKR